MIWDDPENMGAGVFRVGADDQGVEHYDLTLLEAHSYLQVTGAGGDEEGTEESMELNGIYASLERKSETFFFGKLLCYARLCPAITEECVYLCTCVEYCKITVSCRSTLSTVRSALYAVVFFSSVDPSSD